MTNKQKNIVNTALLLRRYLTRPGKASKYFVSEDLLADARNNDISALFHTGIVALINNKVGFAERSFHFAATAGHSKAKKAIALLKQCDTTSKWRDAVLYLYNSSSSWRD